MAGAVLAGALFASTAAAQTTIRVSLDPAGGEGNGGSSAAVVSADGKFVAFHSYADDLVAGDTNGCADVFVRDLQTGMTTRVSVSSSGVEGNGDSFEPAISADGRCIAFQSHADNLVAGDLNGLADVFVHEVASSQTSLVSRGHGGQPSNGLSRSASISGDGRLVAFLGAGTNLVPNDTNGSADSFVHNLSTGLTRRVNVSSSGGQGRARSEPPTISQDGISVVFAYPEDDLVAFDNNNKLDVFHHDLNTGATTLVSLNSAGFQGNSSSGGTGSESISADGRFVAFGSSAGNLVPGDRNGRTDVFVRDRLLGLTTRVSVDSAGLEGNGSSTWPALSADGAQVAFHSVADNLVAQDTNGVQDVFLHDRSTGRTSRISVSTAGSQGSGMSADASLSGDARVIAFESFARDLVPGDTNDKQDVFVHDPLGDELTLELAGGCPGPIRLTISHASAGGPTAIACGVAGPFVRLTPPCAGLLLGVMPPAETRILRADAGGTVQLNIQAPAGVCGLSVQAVDVVTCTATNVIVL